MADPAGAATVVDAPDSPKQVIDASLSRTREIVAAVKELQKRQEEADRDASKELTEHEKDKQRIKAMLAEQLELKKVVDREVKAHQLSKEKMEKEDRGHAKTRDALQAAKDDVASMRLQMDAMRVEMEAQRKAFVINVNWAARCTELKTKFDQCCSEYDSLLEKHVQAKSEMDAALRAQEEFRMRHQVSTEQEASIKATLNKNEKDIQTQREQCGDIAAKLAELALFRSKRAEEEARKKLGSQQALSVLQRSLAAGEKGLKTSAFSGWATLTKTERKQRFQKDRAMKRAMKTIANEGTALLKAVYNEWADDVTKTKKAALQAASKRLAGQNAGAGSMASRQRAIAQLEKQFQGEDLHLKKSCFQGWALGQMERKKKDANHKKASRMIANSGVAMCAEVFGLWNGLTEKRRRKRAAHEANMQKAGRMIANSDRALQCNVVANWWGMIEKIRADRKGKEAGTAKAMRMMANSSMALMNVIFDSWGKMYKESKKKEAGNKKAMRMMNDSASALIITCFGGWKGMFASKKASEASTAKAVRMINASSEALQAACFQSWAFDCRKNRDKNKKMRALEKSFGAQDMGVKAVVFGSWQTYAKLEGRKKRAKEHSMKSAIKSITGGQAVLKCHLFLAWARYASQDKLVKVEPEIKALEGQLTTAVEEARIQLEAELAAATEAVSAMEAKLQESVRERDEVRQSCKPLGEELDEKTKEVKAIERDVGILASELEVSRRKAKDIAEELAKVGIFLSSHAHAPRKNGSGGSSRPGSRPRSGNSAKYDDEKLPKIPTSRPGSGRSGAMTAR